MRHPPFGAASCFGLEEEPTKLRRLRTAARGWLVFSRLCNHWQIYGLLNSSRSALLLPFLAPRHFPCTLPSRFAGAAVPRGWESWNDGISISPDGQILDNPLSPPGRQRAPHDASWSFEPLEPLEPIRQASDGSQGRENEVSGLPRGWARPLEHRRSH